LNQQLFRSIFSAQGDRRGIIDRAAVPADPAIGPQMTLKPTCGPWSHRGKPRSATRLYIGAGYDGGREGYYQCNAPECRKQFTIQVGTVFERSHIPLTKWLVAAFLMTCSKKGISTHQLHRMLGISYKSTWFMTHRLREAMRDGKFPGALGGEGKIVEADETWVGGKEANKHASKRNKTSAARAKRPPLRLWSVGARCARSMCPM
jgi:transposase-like protein